MTTLIHSPEKSYKNGRWNAYNDFLEQRFGEKVYKITVDAGFTCPTRDGSKGYAGCAFCDVHGSGAFFSSKNAGIHVHEQIVKAIPAVRDRFGAKKFIAYFQSYTNTYGDNDLLKATYDGALGLEEVVGIAIGTRPDCINDRVLDLIAQYSEKTFVTLELGLQSFDDDILEFYKRGETAKEGQIAIEKALKVPNLHIGIHLMIGAPKEAEMNFNDLKDLVRTYAIKTNNLGVHSVKIHQLMILTRSILAAKFKINPWKVLELDEYNELVLEFLENLDPAIFVDRTHALASHADELIEPKWALKRHEPRNSLLKLMRERNSFHGKFHEKFHGNSHTKQKTAHIDNQHFEPKLSSGILNVT